MGLLKLLITIICIWLAFRLIIKPILKILVLMFFKRLVQNHQQPQNPPIRKKQDGSVHIDYVPNTPGNPKKQNRDEGEYIEYEEVK